ncbi:MAG: flippase [Methanocellales archaeon]|nr:flippase [Methanocellales archaeon]MDD3421457.1 flippase [Methanocellales archaeon]MDD4898881.1 flippase [Methanocellales archaeon]
MTHLARKVLKNTAFNSSSIIVSGIGGLVFTVILARLLHPELFGIYHLALSVALVMLTFTDLGVNRTMTRYVSYALGKNDKTLARSFFRYLLKIKFLLTTLASIALTILAKPLAIYVFHKPDLILPLEIVGILTFFYSFMDFLDGTFVALQKFQYSTARSITYEISRLAIIPLFVLLGYSVYGALVGLTLSVIFVVVVLFFFLAKRYSYLFKGETVKIDGQRVLRFLGYLTFSTLVSGLFFLHVDAIMLGILMTAKDVGFYKAAFSIVTAFISLVSITSVLFPVFTQLEGDELRNAFVKVFRYLSIFAFPCAFGLAFIARPLIQVMYGAEYLPSVIPFYALCLLILIVPMDFFSILFDSKEKPEYPAKVTVITSGLNIVLNYFLILMFGLIGAAIATLTARYFGAFTLGILSKRVLNIFPRFDSIYKPLFSSFVMLAFLYLIPSPITLLDGIIGIIFAAVIYISVMLLIKGIDKEDMIYLSAVFGQQERLKRMYNTVNSKFQRGGK